MKKISFKQKTRLLSIGFCILLLSPVTADIFFQTSQGIATDILPKNEISLPEIQIRAFYTVQIQLGDNMLLTTGLRFQSEDIFSDSFLKNVPSLLSVDNLSFSYRIPGKGFTTQLAVFAGAYDTVGGDAFLRRYLGTDDIDSPFLQKQIGLEQAGIFTIDGFGVGAISQFSIPIAAAVYSYYNESYSKSSINFDLRFAGVTKLLIGDFTFGFGFPSDTMDSDGEDVVLIIRQVDLHTGFTLLFGDNPYAHLYIQAGASRIQVNPAEGEDVLSLSDLYIFIEPRCFAGNIQFSFSFFMLPDEVVENILYIDNSTGGAFFIEVPVKLGTIESAFGGYLTTSVPNFATTEVTMDTLSIQVAPYAEVMLGTGTFAAVFQFRPMKYATPADMFELSLSYKTTF
ncbi:MAG: hypothetical protein R3Y36_01785 [Spirochaetales bacterium]